MYLVQQYLEVHGCVLITPLPSLLIAYLGDLGGAMRSKSIIGDINALNPPENVPEGPTIGIIGSVRKEGSWG